MKVINTKPLGLREQGKTTSIVWLAYFLSRKLCQLKIVFKKERVNKVFYTMNLGEWININIVCCLFFVPPVCTLLYKWIRTVQM